MTEVEVYSDKVIVKGPKPKLARQVKIKDKEGVRLIRKASKFNDRGIAVFIPFGFYEPGEELEVFLLPGRVAIIRPRKKEKKGGDGP